MTKIKLLQEDITKLKVDAVVNATDSILSGAGGVDFAIHSSAGGSLEKELSKFKVCKTGDAIITKGYNLPCKYIIHTVGPIYRNAKNDSILLRQCYSSSLALCVSNNIKTVAFPAISTGVFGYPKKDAAEIACNTVRDFVKSHPADLNEIIFAVFNEDNYRYYKDILNGIGDVI